MGGGDDDFSRRTSVEAADVADARSLGWTDEHASTLVV